MVITKKRIKIPEIKKSKRTLAKNFKANSCTDIIKFKQDKKVLLKSLTLSSIIVEWSFNKFIIEF